MKNAKKLIGILLALSMVIALVIPASAAGTGKLTIDKAVTGKTYSIYRIFDLESYNATEGEEAFSYKVNEKWEAFIGQATIKNVYVKVDDQNYVTWVEGADEAEFAKKALAYAKAEATRIASVDSKPADSAKVEFTGLDLGYYLVDSTLGALCGLTTTKPTATVEEKNGEPTVEKKVKEGETYGDKNTAGIGDTVEFQVTITAQAGAENYVLHDKMSPGLKFQKVTGITLGEQNVTADGNYTVANENLEAGCTFEVTFTQDFCDTLSANDKIIVSYTATVDNENVIIKSTGNPNETWLTYGDNNMTAHVTTRTYVLDLTIDKVDKATKQEGEGTTTYTKHLPGAEFILYKGTGANTRYAVFADGKLTGWNADETQATPLRTGNDGTITATGLDAGEYFLKETKAPDGYNKLSGPVTVTISESYGTDDTVTVTGNTPVIENSTGSELPSTGGIGTVIFYIVGGILLVGAGILLVVRRRMGSDEPK